MRGGQVSAVWPTHYVCLVAVLHVMRGCGLAASIATSLAIAQPYLPATRAFGDGLGGNHEIPQA